MIRNVVVGRVRPGTDLAQVQQALDAEAEHNRIRREQFDPGCEEIAQVQFES